MPYIPLPDVSLFVREIGSGLPCLVLHGGLGFDHTYLYPWLNTLSGTLRLIYYDHRGNGRSSRPPLSTLTLEQLAHDADALRRHFALDRVAVLGHSFGGFVALQYALQYPRNISHLILVNTAPAWDYGDEIIAHATRRGATPAMLSALNIAEYAADDARLREWYELMTPLYFYRFDPAIARQLVADMVFSASAMLRGLEVIKTYNLTPRLTEIAVPTLVIGGREDFIMPVSQSLRLHQGLPASELLICPHSAHFPYLEEPEYFAQAVQDWLRRQKS